MRLHVDCTAAGARRRDVYPPYSDRRPSCVLCNACATCFIVVSPSRMEQVYYDIALGGNQRFSGLLMSVHPQHLGLTDHTDHDLCRGLSSCSPAVVRGVVQDLHSTDRSNPGNMC